MLAIARARSGGDIIIVTPTISVLRAPSPSLLQAVLYSPAAAQRQMLRTATYRAGPFPHSVVFWFLRCLTSLHLSSSSLHSPSSSLRAARRLPRTARRTSVYLLHFFAAAVRARAHLPVGLMWVTTHARPGSTVTARTHAATHGHAAAASGAHRACIIAAPRQRVVTRGLRLLACG